MCGIILASRKDGRPIAKSLLKRFRTQRHRGKDGFGYVTFDNGKIGEVKQFEKEDDMEKSLLKEKSSEILFHHRFPTSTPNIEGLNHPITIDFKGFKSNYYVIHNGVIRNADRLKRKHNKKGLFYSTVMEKTFTKSIKVNESVVNETEEVVKKFNDSESLAYELALYFEGEQTEIDAEGTIAFIVISTDKEGNVENIFYGRNSGNPLVVERDKNSNMLFLKSLGNGSQILEDEIVQIDYKTDDVFSQKVRVGKVWGNEPKKKQAGFNTQHGHKTEESLPRNVREVEEKQARLLLNDTDTEGYDSGENSSNDAIIDEMREDLDIRQTQALLEMKECVDAIADTQKVLKETGDQGMRTMFEEDLIDLQTELMEVQARVRIIANEYEDLGFMADEIKEAMMAEVAEYVDIDNLNEADLS